MNNLYKIFGAALTLAIICILLIPSITQAAPESVPELVVQDKFNWLSSINVSAFLALLFTSTVAGTVFAYANSVMPGLRKADDRTFVHSVRHLTSAVANPIFLLVSNVALIAQITFVFFAAYIHQFEEVILGSIALIGYIATLLITFLGNLPLNKAIISAELPADDSGWSVLRARFESRWTLLNHLRTVTCFLSVAALLVAILIL